MLVVLKVRVLEVLEVRVLEVLEVRVLEVRKVRVSWGRVLGGCEGLGICADGAREKRRNCHVR